MKRSFCLSLAAAVALLAPVLTSAQTQDTPKAPPNFRRQGPLPRAGGPDQPRPRLKEQLGLTETQQTDIRKALEAVHRDRLRRSTDLKIAKLDLRSLLREEKVDEKAVAAKVAEASAAQGALLKLRVDAALAMKRILTPEQQKKFAELGADHGMRTGQRMRMRGLSRRGPGPMRRGMGLEGPGDDLDLDVDNENNDRDGNR